jgi:hypothetical protein
LDPIDRSLSLRFDVVNEEHDDKAPLLVLLLILLLLMLFAGSLTQPHP